MNDLNQLQRVFQEENKLLRRLEQLKKEKGKLLEHLIREKKNKRLNRKQVSDLLEYNYYYMSRLNIPFRDGIIWYLDLLEWIKENKPGRIKLLERNYNSYSST